MNKLWTDPHNMEHNQESAEIVAKLVGFCESGDHASKEMFQLNFVSHSHRKPYYCSMVLMLYQCSITPVFIIFVFFLLYND